MFLLGVISRDEGIRFLAIYLALQLTTHLLMGLNVSADNPVVDCIAKSRKTLSLQVEGKSLQKT